MGRIVVGVDGSDNSRRALQWAAEEARVRGASLEVVHAYDYSPAWLSYGYETMSATQVETVQRELEASAGEAAAQAQALVDDMVSGLQDLDVEAVAVEGHRPAQTLVERSADAELLVVGSRGRGGFAGLLLGSVSQQAATHASCPVVVIRPSKDRASR